MSITEEYDRKLYDNKSAKDICREESFGAGKTFRDGNTGDLLHKNIDAAKNKYGQNNYTKHIGDVDHNIPIKAVHDVVKNSPLAGTLTDKDINDAVNSKENLQLISANENRAKGAKTPFEVGAENIKNGNILKGGKQIAKGAKSAAHITKDLGVAAVKNTVNNAKKQVQTTAEDAKKTMLAAVGAVGFIESGKSDAAAEKTPPAASKQTAQTDAISCGAFDYVTKNAQFACTGGGAPFTVTAGDSKKVTFNGAGVLTKDTKLRGSSVCAILTAMAQGVPQPCRCSLSPWQPIDYNCSAEGKELLLSASKSICRAAPGGIVSVAVSGVFGRFTQG